MSNNIPSAISSLGLSDNYHVYTSEQMREYLLARLKKLTNWNEIDQVLNKSGTLDLIIDLVSSASEINSFFNLRSQQESFLEFAQIDENIFAKAKELGYRINRYSAPSVTVRYNDIPTLTLRRGDVLGTVGQYDLIYFDQEEKVIEKGDLIPLVVGKYGEKSRQFTLDETGDISIELTPEVLKSIDNNYTVLLYDGIEHEKTLFTEDYIVFNQWCDFSDSLTSATIHAANFELSYGLFEIFQKGIARSFTVKYIETDGVYESLSQPDVNVDNRFLVYQISSTGYECDTMASIVKYAPLMYSLQRRAVTENDYKFLLSHLPQFYDVSISTYKGKLGTYDIKISQVKQNTNYWVMINEITYAYQNTLASNTNDDIIYILYQQLKASELVKVTMMGEEGSKYIRMVSISAKSLLSVSANKDVLNCVVIQENTPPAQCTLHVQYVSVDTVKYDTTVSLTNYEYQNQIAPLVDKYKMVGLTLLYEHCKRVELNLKYLITLVDESDKELVDSLIEDVMKEYNYHTDIVIDTNDIGNNIAHYANFKYGRQIISNVVDSVKSVAYIEKSQYCKINYEIVYAN